MAGGLPFTSLYPEDPNAPGGAGGAGGGAADVNRDWPGLPPGASPDMRDLTLTVATGAAGTVIWQPAADERVVIVSAFISSDAAGRVAIVEDQDVQGQRIAVQFVGANGGSAPNLVPAPWPTAVPGAPIRVVSTVVGNLFVRVSGYIVH